jgi:hypothetical protein
MKTDRLILLRYPPRLLLLMSHVLHLTVLFLVVPLVFDAWSSMPRPRYPPICSAFIVRSYYLVFASAPLATPPIVHRSFYVTHLSFIIYPFRSFLS